MDRRVFAISALSSVGLVSGCDSTSKPSPEVEVALGALDSAIGGLEGAVGSFSSEDWKEVVPEVEGASSDVRAAFHRLRVALGYD